MPTTTTRAQRHELHNAVIVAQSALRSATAAYHVAFAAAKTKRIGTARYPCECCMYNVYEATPPAAREALVASARARRTALAELVSAQKAYRAASMNVFGSTESAEEVCRFLRIEKIECEVSPPPTPGASNVFITHGSFGPLTTVEGVRAACSAKTFERIVNEVEAARFHEYERMQYR